MDFESFNIQEQEFFIQQTEAIEIKPFFNMDRIDLLSGSFGPFKPINTVVPLWLALYFKERNKCKVIPPNWLNTNDLEELKQLENQEDNLQQLPDTFFDIGYMLLNKCNDDLESSDKILIQLQELEKIREEKIKQIINIKIHTETKVLQFNNITQFEINKLRGTLEPLLKGVAQLRKFRENTADNQENQ